MLLFFSLLSSIYLCQLHFQMLRFRASRLDVAQEWLGSGNICQGCFSHTHSSLIISIFKFILSQRNKPDNKKLPDLSDRQIRRLIWQRRKDSPSLRLGSTAVATCHRHVAKSRLFESFVFLQKNSPSKWMDCFFWQRRKDSNPHKRSQSPVCYLYTTPLERVLLYRIF